MAYRPCPASVKEPNQRLEICTQRGQTYRKGEAISTSEHKVVSTRILAQSAHLCGLSVPSKRRWWYPKHLLNIVLSLHCSPNHSLGLSWVNSGWHKPKHPSMKQNGPSQASTCAYVHLTMLRSDKMVCGAVDRLDGSSVPRTTFSDFVIVASSKYKEEWSCFSKANSTLFWPLKTIYKSNLHNR